MDQNGRGLLTEQELVQRLGSPDGQVIVGQGKDLVYYYDRFGTRDELVVAELSGGVLVHFGYTSASQWPPSQLQPYPAPATAPYHAGAEHAR